MDKAIGIIDIGPALRDLFTRFTTILSRCDGQVLMANSMNTNDLAQSAYFKVEVTGEKVHLAPFVYTYQNGWDLQFENAFPPEALPVWTQGLFNFEMITQEDAITTMYRGHLGEIRRFLDNRIERFERENNLTFDQLPHPHMGDCDIADLVEMIEHIFISGEDFPNGVYTLNHKREGAFLDKPLPTKAEVTYFFEEIIKKQSEKHALHVHYLKFKNRERSVQKWKEKAVQVGNGFLSD